MPDPKTRTIGVVIPFYQEDADLLSRCVTSVIQQDVGDDVRFLIVAVDDESPVPLEKAVKGLVISPPHELVCLKRPNGGPGAARNTALEYLAHRKPDFVAFIDSDDVWRPEHIDCALVALGEDGDFFFCDHDRWDYPTSYLEDSEPFQRWLSCSPSPLILLGQIRGDMPAAYQFRADEAFQAFVEDYLAQTSTVFYRFSQCPQIRFDPSLRYAGEDNMFWLQLSKAARAVRLSTAKNVVTGKGVNMFAGSMGWSHPKAAQRTAAQVWFFLTVDSNFGRDARAKAMVDRRLAWHGAEFAQVWVRKFLRRPAEAIRIIAPLIKRKPSLLYLLPFYFMGDVYPKRRYRRK